MKVDKTNELVERIAADIRAGNFGTMGNIPSRPKLKEIYQGYGLGTIDRAMVHLKDAGLVMLSGRQIAPTPDRFPVPGLTRSFDGFLKLHGKEPQFETISISEMELDEETATLFRLPLGYKSVLRVRLQGEKLPSGPYWYRLANTYYPHDLAQGYLPAIKEDDHFNVTEELEPTVGKISYFNSSISSRFPTIEEQNLLGITYSTPVVVDIRLCYTAKDVLVMFNKIVWKAYHVEYKLDHHPYKG